MLDALSGTAETETGQNSDLNNLYSFQHTGENLFIRPQWWRELYEGIGNANLAIKRIPEIPAMDEEDVKALGGPRAFSESLPLLLACAPVGRCAAADGTYFRFLLAGCNACACRRRKMYMP